MTFHEKFLPIHDSDWLIKSDLMTYGQIGERQIFCGSMQKNLSESMNVIMNPYEYHQARFHAKFAHRQRRTDDRDQKVHSQVARRCKVM
jgi:hypothetical protein